MATVLSTVHRTFLSGVVAGGMLLAGAGLFVSASRATADYAGAGAASGACGCVVSVNITTIIEQLDQRKEAELGLQTIAQGMQAEDEAHQAMLKALATELEGMDVNAPSRESLLDDFNLKSVQYQGWREYAKERLDIEKSLLLRELDRQVREAISELAAIEGYDIVLIEDATRELTVSPDSNVPREIQVKQQMGNRRLMYAGGKANVTADVIARMNNAYQNGR